MDIEPYVREYGLSISNITVSKIEKYDFEMNMQVLMAMIVSDSDYFGGEDKAKELSDYVLAFKDFLVENNVDLNNIYKVNFDWKVIVENANVWEEDTELVLSNRNSGLYLIVYKYNDSWYYLPYNQYYIYYITQFFEG